MLIRSLLVLLLFLSFLTSPVAAGVRLKLATTTSTENSGLLDVLLPPFERAHSCQIDVIAVGTGKALQLGVAGDVDLVMVHARKKEDAFVAAGHGLERKDLMYNDFVLLGPASDPAGIEGEEDVVKALRKVASSGALFISRGDQSGTHTRELELWQSAKVATAGSWYLEAGRGMGEVITMATESRAYTLADRGTYLAYHDKSDLEIMVTGDRRLYNPYGVIIVNPERHPHVQYDLARKFVDYLLADEGQQLIAGYRRNDEPLFFIFER